jgi:SAM-dependent methyltransferase
VSEVRFSSIFTVQIHITILPCPSTGEKRKEQIARTAYYDRIAKQWHRLTGYHGGVFKRYVLNDSILSQINSIAGNAIIELGAGNGYFAPLMLRRFSGQQPERLVITDQSQALLTIAQTTFWIDGAEYFTLDLQDPFPFPDNSFHIILASMVFNELTTNGLNNALQECRRILVDSGMLIAAVPHPDLVHALAKKGVLTDFGHGLFAMPSAEGMRLPVSRRPTNAYCQAIKDCGFTVITEDIYPDEKTLHEKQGLKVSRGTPLGLLFVCHRE